MNQDGDRSTDEYIVTALQIFHYCGANSTSTIRVDTLMDKFAPFVKTNKAEYSYLRSLLDPDQTNPEINVSILASTLNKYSENQKIKVDLDESFNLKSGQVPHDSDSGISTDGFILLEELQCELREKSHLIQQLRTQLDYSDRHQEEALAAITAERDALRAHLDMLRDESASLANARRDYDDVCERLASSERALGDARRELEHARRRNRSLADQVAALENEKLTLQDLLSKSKEECHRINDMYASRQSNLLEENETLRADHADLAARMQDQEEFMQQIIKEKVLLEMELKDMLNKSNQTHLKLDRSIDVSYTEDQMLTALDSLNTESRFQLESRLLDDESFAKALKDQGRATNISLFDEIRLSFCSMSRDIDLNNSNPFEKHSDIDNSLVTVAIQTDEIDANVCMKTDEKPYEVLNECTMCREHNTISYMTSSCQTYDSYDSYIRKDVKNKMTNTSNIIFEVFRDVEVMNMGTQTTDEIEPYCNNNNDQVCIECTKCTECDKLNKYIKNLEGQLIVAKSATNDVSQEIDNFEDNLDILKRLLNEENERNKFLKSIVDSLRAKLLALQEECVGEGDKIQELCNTCSAGIQTDSEQTSVSTQADTPCTDCLQRNTSRHRIRRYLWDPIKCLFQLFAVICFVCAISALCGITRRQTSCREPTPWRWLQPYDLVDLLLSVEYVADVPM